MLGGFKSTIVFSERLLVCEFDVPTIYTGTPPLTWFSYNIFFFYLKRFFPAPKPCILYSVED